MITPVQCRMARAALNWSLRGFAKEVGINFNTVVRFESGGDPKASIMHKMEMAFRNAGVAFHPDGQTVKAPDTEIRDKGADLDMSEAA